jgi:hypothetical protein
LGLTFGNNKKYIPTERQKKKKKKKNLLDSTLFLSSRLPTPSTALPFARVALKPFARVLP